MMPTAPDTNLSIDFETALLELNALARVLRHLVASANQLEGDDLFPIANALQHCHDRLDAGWQALFEQRHEERQAHERSLAEAKAAAAPLCPAEVKRVEMWRGIMLTVARSVIEACEAGAACDRTEQRDGADGDPAPERRGFQDGGF